MLAPKLSKNANPVAREWPARSTHGLTGISNTFHLAWLDRCLTWATEWRQADGSWPYRRKIFDASHLWHDWFSFSGPSLWEVARAGSLSPGAPWPSTRGRCEAGNRWRQKPKKSIGPVSQGRGGRLLKTQSRRVFAAWCRSTAHLRTHWISPSPSLFIYSARLCTHILPPFLGGRGGLNLSGSKGKAASHVVRLVLHDINRKNSLETIWIVWNK